MPRHKQTEEERDAMRARILDAAHELLLEQGPDALSIRAIAERVGVSHMVLYTYFESHAALVQALRARIREWRKAWRAAQLQRAETGDVAAVLREALVFYTTRATEHPRMYKFMWVQPASKISHRDLCHQFQCHLRHLTQLVQIGIARGVFADRDPTVAAATVFAMIHAPLLLYHNGRLVDAALRDQISAEALAAALGYLGARGERLQRI